MRYFRVTINPASLMLDAQGVAHLRLQIPLTHEMIDQDFSDGSYISVDDGKIGELAAHLDFLQDTDTPNTPPYNVFQEVLFESIPDIALQQMQPESSLRVPSNQP